MHPRILFNWFVPPINPLEKKLINVLATYLSPEAKSILVKQIEQINLVQRHASCKEVNFYCIKQSKSSFDISLSFANNLPELKLASIIFKVSSERETISADFWLVHGRLFSIIFDKSPKHIKPKDIEIKEVKVLINPMLFNEIEPKKPIKTIVLTGWLYEWTKKWNLTQLKEPLPIEQREKIIRQLDTILPDEYLEVVTQTEGLEIGKCRILGLSEISDVAMPMANYYILSEIEGCGVISVMRKKIEVEIYYFNYEDTIPIKKGSSFRNAIEEQIKLLNNI